MKSAEGLAVIEGFATAITACKQHAEKLKRLQSAIEHVTETVVITDPDGVMQYVKLCL